MNCIRTLPISSEDRSVQLPFNTYFNRMWKIALSAFVIAVLKLK